MTSWKITFFNRGCIFKCLFFHCHVSFPEGAIFFQQSWWKILKSTKLGLNELEILGASDSIAGCKLLRARARALVRDEPDEFFADFCPPMQDEGQTFTPRKFNSWPLKIGRNPKGNDRILTIHFQGLC